MTVFLTTPTGNIAGRTLDVLMSRQTPVSALVRSVRSAAFRERVGGSVVVREGAIDDSAALIEASAGADAVFLVLPPDPHSPDLARWWTTVIPAVVAAIQENSIGHVVFISSQAADRGGCDLIDVLREGERALRESAPNVRILRPGYFLEGLLNQVDAFRSGTIQLSTSSTTILRTVVAREVGDLAADLLSDLSWRGQEAFSVYGPDWMTPGELTAAISEVTGLPIIHETLDSDVFRGYLVQSGMTESTASSLADLFAFFSSMHDEPDDVARAVTTPSSVRDYLREFLLPLLAG